MHSNQIELFKKLHDADELLILGNAWDRMSARALEKSGFKANRHDQRVIAKSLGLNDGEQIDFDIQINKQANSRSNSLAFYFLQ